MAVIKFKFCELYILACYLMKRGSKAKKRNGRWKFKQVTFPEVEKSQHIVLECSKAKKDPSRGN